MLLNLCELSVRATSRLHARADIEVDELDEGSVIISVECNAGPAASTASIYIGRDTARLSRRAEPPADSLSTANDAGHGSASSALSAAGVGAAVPADFSDAGGDGELLLLYAQSVVEGLDGTLEHSVSGPLLRTGFRVSLPVSPPAATMPPTRIECVATCAHTGSEPQCAGTVAVCLAGGPLADLVVHHARAWGFRVLDLTVAQHSDAAAARATLARTAAERGGGRDGGGGWVWVVEYGRVVGLPDSAELLRVLGPGLVLVGRVGQGYADTALDAGVGALDGESDGPGLRQRVEACLLVRPVKLSALRARLQHVLSPSSPAARSPRGRRNSASGASGAGMAVERDLSSRMDGWNGRVVSEDVRLSEHGTNGVQPSLWEAGDKRADMRMAGGQAGGACDGVMAGMSEAVQDGPVDGETGAVARRVVEDDRDVAQVGVGGRRDGWVDEGVAGMMDEERSRREKAAGKVREGRVVCEDGGVREGERGQVLDKIEATKQGKDSEKKGRSDNVHVGGSCGDVMGVENLDSEAAVVRVLVVEDQVRWGGLGRAE